MKKAILTLALILGLNAFVNAQEIKMGYSNVDYILANMPEAPTVQAQLEGFESALTGQLRTRMQTFQQRVATYQQGVEMMTAEARATEEADLQRLQVEIQQSEANYQSQVQLKQVELFQPLYAKIQEAIDLVAAEQGYVAIFASAGLLYADETTLVDISDEVFEKLGITPPSQAVIEE